MARSSSGRPAPESSTVSCTTPSPAAHVRRTGGAPSPADAAVVRFTLDHETALGIARGTGSAQQAFMAGALQVGGDLRVLLDHQVVLSALHDVFAAVRAQTDLAEVG